jgi:hypothetical protein
MPYQEEPALPSHIATRLPALELLQDALLDGTIEISGGCRFYRGAWNGASVWPGQVTRTYRFGPPDVLIGSDGRYPFHWVYAASHVITAAWEAQFCANDATRPGTFYIRPGAADALLATLSFSQPIRLLDLTGTAASKLGVYDNLRSPDYEWCQWFGYRLDQVIASEQGTVHGFRYPSRRHPGYDAYAISSRTMGALSGSLSHSIVRFCDAEEFAHLTRDVCCVPPP